jgi:hypothetical protein
MYSNDVYMLRANKLFCYYRIGHTHHRPIAKMRAWRAAEVTNVATRLPVSKSNLNLLLALNPYLPSTLPSLIELVPICYLWHHNLQRAVVFYLCLSIHPIVLLHVALSKIQISRKVSTRYWGTQKYQLNARLKVYL